MMLKRETTGDDTAEEWSTPINWEEDYVIKGERRKYEKHTLLTGCSGISSLTTADDTFTSPLCCTGFIFKSFSTWGKNRRFISDF